jgi:hypothetical protein
MKVEMIRLTRPSPSPVLTAILQRRLWDSYSGSQKVNPFTHRAVSNQLFSCLITECLGLIARSE